MGMRKERLELFSDGVFAIILTLLVLDLKPPELVGLEGLRSAAPGLLVHAGAFFVIGMAWMTHHQFLEHVETIDTRMLGLNLLALFWVTLVPYGARISAEHPNDGLGVAIMTFGIALNLGSLLLMSQTGHFTSIVNDPQMVTFRTRRVRMLSAHVVFGLVMSALCFSSPWFGYAYLSFGATVLFIPSVSEAHARLLAPSDR